MGERWQKETGKTETVGLSVELRVGLSIELSVGLSVGLSPFLSPSVSPGFTTRKKDYRVRRKNKLYSPNPVSILYLKALSSAFLIE
jgi:hypothetical protein